MNIEQRAERAMALKQSGAYNCCQAVAAALALNAARTLVDVITGDARR